MPDINWLAAIVAGLVGMFVGGAWYGVFGKAWIAETGLTPEQVQKMPKGKIYGVSALLSVLGAIGFAFFLGKVAPLTGALYGFTAGLFWVAGSFGINYLFEGKSLKLWAINGGYHTLQYTLIGLILGTWH
jgi:Protein of unknown function (DUF1761)